MKVLVACEYSGVVRDAFLAKGHEAMSCDLLPSERPEGPHYQGDVRDILNDGWDLMVAHPHCTYHTNAGVRFLHEPDADYICDKTGQRVLKGAPRWRAMEEAAKFFRLLYDCDIEKKCIENPIMHKYAVAAIGLEGKPQYVQPWQFGHKQSKATGFRLVNLPNLVPTDIVGPPPKDKEERKAWHKIHLMPRGPDRWKERSRTFEGIAKAMADQWG
jgi:hypothetical protein